MGLFQQILQAIDNPEQEGSSNQLAGIINTVQQLSNNYHIPPNTVQSVLSIVGKYTRSALQQQRQQNGEAQVQQTISEFGGAQESSQVLHRLFTNPQIQQLIGEVTAKTGLDTNQIQSMLPMLVPLVLNFLKTGTNFRIPLGGNNVLNSFLDADGDGDVDLADALQMTNRYLGA